MHTHYELGTANAICDRCGFKMKLHALRKEWTGLKVCSKCWEPRHPQDFVTGVPDFQAVKDPRPEAADHFLTTNEVTPGSL